MTSKREEAPPRTANKESDDAGQHHDGGHSHSHLLLGLRRRLAMAMLVVVSLQGIGMVYQRASPPSLLATSRPTNRLRRGSSAPPSSLGRLDDALQLELEEAEEDEVKEEGFEEKGRDDECSCHNSYANASCCKRLVLTNHKFGSVLTSHFIKPYKGIKRKLIQPTYLPPEASRQDYRHVVVARNYPEAFVSGYLYHKSGRECWLFLNGQPLNSEKFFGWEQNVELSGFDVGMYPPPNNRSLCRYLADESEEDGMKVYMAVALHRFYRGLDDYYRIVDDRRRQRRLAPTQPDKSLFLCLGDFPDPASQRRMFDVMMDWLYPGGHNLTLPPRAADNTPDHKGHASPGNATQRLRLLEMVGRYDQEFFNGTVAATDSLLGCHGTVHRRRRRRRRT